MSSTLVQKYISSVFSDLGWHEEQVRPISGLQLDQIRDTDSLNSLKKQLTTDPVHCRDADRTVGIQQLDLYL